MKTKTFVLIIFLAFNCSYSQSKENLKTLKKYALHKCLLNNYIKADSSFISHDYTASYVFQIKSIDFELLNKIDEYVEKHTSNYYKTDVVENLEDNKANYICWYCIEFYESKELEAFIKKL